MGGFVFLACVLSVVGVLILRIRRSKKSHKLLKLPLKSLSALLFYLVWGT